MLEIFFPNETRTLKLDEQDANLWFSHNWIKPTTDKKYFSCNFGQGDFRRAFNFHQKINPDYCLTDHKDGDKWNNQRENLREASYQDNNRNRTCIKDSPFNTSKYKGVYLHSKNNNWIARICINSKTKHIGVFHSEEEAARAYDIKAKEVFGEFANTNFKD